MCVCVCVCECYIHWFKGVSTKMLFFVHMNVQFLLWWCVERDISELSPLSRNVYQEYLLLFKSQISLSCYNFVQVSHMYYYMHIIFTLSCNHKIVYVIFLQNHLQGLKNISVSYSKKKTHNILTHSDKQLIQELNCVYVPACECLCKQK